MRTSRIPASLRRVAERTLSEASSRGADATAVAVKRSWQRSVEARDGNLDEIEESISNTLTIRLFHHERYGVFQTSDLRPAAISRFLERAFDVVAALEADPLRALPGPALYRGATRLDLELQDPLPPLELDELLRRVAAIEQAARGAAERVDVATVASGVSERRSCALRLHSDGFRAASEASVLHQWCSVTLRDTEERRPLDHAVDGATWRDRLEPPEAVGLRAMRRARQRLGASSLATGRMPVVVEARAAVRLVDALLDALSGPALAQRRSFLVGRLGQRVASGHLTLHDDPHVPGGLGSRRHDAEGMAAHPRTLIDHGVLTGLLLDTYHARKLGQAPSSGSVSNAVLVPGSRDLGGLLCAVGEGLLVTGFLGGNVNATTGDFSLGVVGSEVREGVVSSAVAGANLSGNLLELFGHLVEAGNDPLRTSAMRIPSLRFCDVQVSGT